MIDNPGWELDVVGDVVWAKFTWRGRWWHWFFWWDETRWYCRLDRARAHALGEMLMKVAAKPDDGRTLTAEPG